MTDRAVRSSRKHYYSYGECLNNGGCAVTQSGCSFTLDCEDRTTFSGEIAGDGKAVSSRTKTLLFRRVGDEQQGSGALSCVGDPGGIGWSRFFELECEDGGECSSGS